MHLLFVLIIAFFGVFSSRGRSHSALSLRSFLPLTASIVLLTSLPTASAVEEPQGSVNEKANDEGPPIYYILIGLSLCSMAIGVVIKDIPSKKPDGKTLAERHEEKYELALKNPRTYTEIEIKAKMRSRIYNLIYQALTNARYT